MLKNPSEIATNVNDISVKTPEQTRYRYCNEVVTDPGAKSNAAITMAAIPMLNADLLIEFSLLLKRTKASMGFSLT
jgi:hypothetical protein